MPLALKNNCNKWTYADYLIWPDDERWELIDGVAYSMSPVPTTTHQRILRNLAFAKYAKFEGKRCELFLVPFDVRFSKQQNSSDNYVDTVVQPDILVVCDKSKLDELGCNGPPDFIVEISSHPPARMI